MMVDAVVLAAGSSSRLGRNKQLLRIGGETLIRRAVNNARSANVRHIAVVTGFRPDAVRAELADLGTMEIHNPAWETGMGSSLAAAVSSAVLAAWRPDAVLVILPDQYLVTTEHLAALLAAARESPQGITATRYGDEQGAPAVFKARYFVDLAALAPAAGARPLLKKFSEDVRLVDCPDAAFDLDTSADLARLDASLLNI
jgi:CTP:molybdopterin cytidylyltransferase MocA